MKILCDKKLSKISSILLCSLIPFMYANANEKFKVNASIDASIGVINGIAHELVYDGDHKLSQLDWETKYHPIINLGFSADIDNILTLDISGFKSIIKTKGMMHDYDWTNYRQKEWTHLSMHNNTIINNINGFEINLKIWMLKNELLKLGFIAGYSRHSFSWNAKDGTFLYPYLLKEGNTTYNDYNARRLLVINDGKPVISYQQIYSTPYLGLTSSFVINNFELNGLLKIGIGVNVNAYDIHHARNITFDVVALPVDYYGFKINTNYKITNNLKLLYSFSYDHYKEARGDTRLKKDDIINVYKNTGALSNTFYTMSMGLEYSL